MTHGGGTLFNFVQIVSRKAIFREVENEIIWREAAPGAAGRGARVPYGESTFKRNRPSFAVLMVLWWGVM